MARDVLDMEKAVEAEFGAGAMISGVDPNGDMRVKVPDGKGSFTEEKVNYVAALQADGIDPTKVDVQFNRPETASDSSNLNFGTKLKLALAKTPEDKFNVLQQDLGKENVMDLAGNLVVKENGVWTNADDGWAAPILASTPGIVGGVAGRVAGAASGFAAAGPVGAYIGGAVGGGLGTTIADAIVQQGTEALGIRSEQDAVDAWSEIGKELALNTAFEMVLPAAGKALKLGAKAVGVAGKTAGAAARAGIETGEIKAAGAAAHAALGKGLHGDEAEAFASFAQRMAPQTDKESWATLIRSGEDASAVKEGLESIAKWNQTPQAIRSVVSPVKQEMVDLTQTAMKAVKAQEMKSYNAGWQLLKDSGALKEATIYPERFVSDFRVAASQLDEISQKTVQPVLNQLERLYPSEVSASKTIAGLGSTEYGSFKKTAGKLRETAPDKFALAEDQTMGKLSGQKVYTNQPNPDLPLQGTPYKPAPNYRPPGASSSIPKQETFMTVKSALDNIDGLLESSGFYNQGEAQISSQARAALMKLRGDMHEALVDGLNDSGVLIRGVQGGDFYKNLAAKYSAFRSVYDDFAMPSRLGGDQQKIFNTVERLMSDKQSFARASFMRMINDAGSAGKKIVGRLEQLNAADDLAKSYPSTGWGAELKAMAGRSPKDLANAIADQTVRAQRKAVMSATPLQTMKTPLMSLAKTVNWTQSLSSQDKKQVFTNPALMIELLKSMGIEQYEQAGGGQ